MSTAVPASDPTVNFSMNRRRLVAVALFFIRGFRHAGTQTKRQDWPSPSPWRSPLYPFDQKSPGDFVGAPGTRESPACYSPAVTAMPISIGRIEAIFRYP